MVVVKKGDIVKFDIKKNFTYIKPLGNGGTGDTHLFQDETTNILFAFKKYVPKDVQYIEEYYQRFVDEIKILFEISHANIVRVYNYYLYPEAKTGYLQMEYVDGYSIDKYQPNGWGKDWNDIFTEVIYAFEYLETNGILHRDVRPANILIDKNDNVKIIDFGFGKKLDVAKKEENSILLNWPVSEMPDEVQLNHEYNHKTEIYFVGTLFRHLFKGLENELRYSHIIEKMTKINPSQRYQSFSDIVSDISAGVLGEIDFSEKEKNIYRKFANDISTHINHYVNKYSPVNNISYTLSKLSELIRNSALEEYIQDNSQLIGCFINGGYNYMAGRDIELKTIVDFYSLFTSLLPTKQNILYDNIYNRLSRIRIQVEEDEIPF